MSEFKTIETQEELDRIISDRLARQKEKYGDYDQLKTRVMELETENGALQSAVEAGKSEKSRYEQDIAGLKQQVAGYETASLRTRVALANGIPYDLADRLVGDDEASLKADAERLAGFMRLKEPTAPLKTTEPAVGDAKTVATQQFIQSLTNKGE